RFETLAADRTAYVLDQIHLLQTNPELADMPAETFRQAPDRRTARPVVTALERRWNEMPWSARMKLAQSLANLRALGVANAQYRHDNHDYLPFVGIGPSPRGVPVAGQQLSGWATWTFGGKNCNAFWFTRINGIFDVEAADRPLNRYVYPGFTYTAPPPPQRLPANSPARLNEQAKVYQDPADLVGHQQNWPNANPASGGRPPLSCYDDIGTSYHMNMSWDDQLQSRISNFTARFNEGTRRLAVGQGVDPARFVIYNY
ncbi:MAG: hypothetical protein AABZ53_09870, partial [Planctomycetota bacterium]